MASTSTGSAGKYLIEKAGYHPQAGDAFLYRDSLHEFWFYVELTGVGAGDLLVKDASSERFAGGIPMMSVQNQEIVEGNIREYFHTVDLFGRPITSLNPAPTIAFSWKLRP